MRIGSLCSGYGGLDLAVEHMLGARTVWHAEVDPDASRVLAVHWPGVPNLGDLTAVDWSTVEPVDVLTAGFPCQDVSSAGKRAGIAPGTRTGLWTEVARAIDQLRPPLVVLENVRGLLSARAASHLEPCLWCLGDEPREPALRALGAVLGDLADLGYDAAWLGVPAAEVGAPHLRWRVFILAWPASDAERGGRDGRARLTVGQPIGGAVATRGGAAVGGAPGVRLLPTATAMDSRGARNATSGRKAGSEHHDGWTLGDIAHADRWGEYAPAIARWEAVLGRPAPDPTEPGQRGQPRLSPRFVEWLMGLPAGWVTDHVGRNPALRVLGNGVVPQQAALALSLLRSSMGGAA